MVRISTAEQVGLPGDGCRWWLLQ